MLRLFCLLMCAALTAAALGTGAASAAKPPKPPKPPPPGTPALTIAAAPNPITFLGSTTISGTLSGTANAGQTVQLEAREGSTGAFKPVAGATATTSAKGDYSFTTNPTANTTYRVTTTANPKVMSPEVLVGVRLRVSLRVSDSTPRRGQSVKFSGGVRPAQDGAVARIQRRSGSSFRTVARTTLRPGNGQSVYSRRLRISRSGVYRVYVRPLDDTHFSGRSRARTLTVH